MRVEIYMDDIPIFSNHASIEAELTDVQFKRFKMYDKGDAPYEWEEIEEQVSFLLIKLNECLQWNQIANWC